MKMAAIILSIVGALAVPVCLVAYYIGTLFICFDTCSSLTDAYWQWPLLYVISASPAILLSLAAWWLGMRYLLSQRSNIVFRILTLAPLPAVALVLITLYISAGSVVPVADTTLAIATPVPLVSRDWLAHTYSAIIPLVAWPIICLVIVALTPQRANTARVSQAQNVS